MPEYICPRCGYSSHIRTYLHKHFLRKKTCIPKISNVDIYYCYKKVMGEEHPDIVKNNTQSIFNKNVNANVNAGVNASVNASVNVNANVNAKMDNVNAKMDNVNADVNAKMDSVNANVNVENDTVNVNINDNKITKYQCKYCNKYLNSRQGRYAHHKICKGKDNPLNSSLEPSYISDSTLSQDSKDLIINQQARQLEIMKGQIEVLLNQNSTPNIQNIQGDQNNVNFYINAFGKENIEYITGNIIQKLITHEPMNSVPKLLQNIHFHPNHTENHNIYIPNKKDSLAKIYDGTKWVYRKKKEAIEDMANKALIIMEESDNTNNIATIKEQYFDGDKKTVNRIHEDTEIMILNEGKNILK